MSEYVVKADDGYENLYINDLYGQSTPDMSQCVYSTIDFEIGTSSDPKTLWSGSGGYVKSSGGIGGGMYGVPYNRMNGSTISGSGVQSVSQSVVNTVKLFVWSVRTGTAASDDYFRVYFALAQNFSDIDFNHLTTNNVLYLNTWAWAQTQGGLFTLDVPWDDTPPEDAGDPNNQLPNGGEYADLEAFNDTDQMPEGGLPDPTIFEEDYNGLLTCYAMFGSGFADFGKSVFQTSFWQSLMNKFNGLSDPLSMIIDCVELPIGHIGSPWVGSAPMMLGGIDVPHYNGSNVYIQHTWARRYYKTNCGSITLKEVWGSAKDYTDASISIYLPYCGVKELDPDIVLRNTLTLYVYVDLWNGDVLYLLHTSNTGFDKKYFTQEAVVYRWTGNCGKKIPIGKVDTSNAIMQVASGIATVGLGVAAGGALGGAMFGAGGSIGAGMIGSSVMGGVNQLADVAANGFKPVVQTSGGVGGSVGRMDYQYPYLIIKRGIPEYPNNWRAEIGAPQYQTYTVSDLTGTGYTLFSHIELGNMGSATEEEKSELERLLTTEGVIL